MGSTSTKAPNGMTCARAHGYGREWGEDRGWGSRRAGPGMRVRTGRGCRATVGRGQRVGLQAGGGCDDGRRRPQPAAGCQPTPRRRPPAGRAGEASTWAHLRHAAAAVDLARLRVGDGVLQHLHRLLHRLLGVSLERHRAAAAVDLRAAAAQVGRVRGDKVPPARRPGPAMRPYARTGCEQRERRRSGDAATPDGTGRPPSPAPPPPSSPRSA